MGSFFTNIQMHINQMIANEQREQLIEALRIHMKSLSYVEVRDDRTRERTILVGPITEHPWIAVYDQSTEGQDRTRLDAVATYLSGALNDKAVSILVHDGDLLELSFFLAGNQIGEITNWPDYFSGASKPSSPFEENDSHLHFWQDVFVEGATEEDFRNAWTVQNHFELGDAILTRLAPLVKWHSDLCKLGYNSIPEPVLLQCTALHFHHEDFLRSQPDMSAPPTLAHEGGTDSPLITKVGDTVQILGISNNTGGTSRGVTVVVWGEALDTGLVMLTRVTLLRGPEDSKQLTEAEFAAVPAETGVIYTAEMMDVELFAGFSDVAAAFAAADGEYDAGIKLWLTARLEAHVDCIAMKPGIADIHIGFVPQANPNEGQTSWTIQLEIRS